MVEELGEFLVTMTLAGSWLGVCDGERFDWCILTSGLILTVSILELDLRIVFHLPILNLII